MNSNSEIKLLRPDLPAKADLSPFLEQIDATHWYSNFGPLVTKLEEVLAARWPAPDTAATGLTASPWVVSLSSGTAALELGITALDLEPNGEVLLPSYTFPATAAAAIRNGLRPVFCDVAADNWLLTPSLARAAATKRRLALVMPVATFGCPVDVTAWDAFVADTGIPVLLDAAAAFGNQAIGHRVHACFSMHATKPFGIGEGGLFVTPNGDLANRVRRLSNFGFHRGQAILVGTNAKLAEYAAAVALAQWARWPVLQQRRAQQWIAYRELIESLPGVRLQQGFAEGAVPANVVVNLPCSAAPIADLMARSGIETRRWYCPPLDRHPAFAGYPLIAAGEGEFALPVTEDLATRSLGLPWHNFLAEDDLGAVGRALVLALTDIA